MYVFTRIYTRRLCSDTVECNHSDQLGLQQVLQVRRGTGKSHDENWWLFRIQGGRSMRHSGRRPGLTPEQDQGLEALPVLDHVGHLLDGRNHRVGPPPTTTPEPS